VIARTIYSEEHESLRASFRRFLQREALPFADAWEAAGQVDRAVYRKAGQEGFLCPMAPVQHGGLGLDFRYNAVIDEEITSAGLSGLAFALHSNVVAPYIYEFGSADLVARYLPGMLSGETIGAIAMTEPGTGSDLKAVTTAAVQDGDHFVINGAKTFVTNGQLCDIVIVVAKTDSAAGARGISLFVVETSTQGVSKGRKLEKLGMKAQDTSELFLADVRVPAANVIGEVGRGFGYLMTNLVQERLGLAVCALTASEVALSLTVDYVKSRRVFGKPLADYQNTQFKLAELDSRVTAGRVFTDRCIELFCEGRLDAVTAAKLKLIASELVNDVADECLQLHGGYGYIWDFPIARIFADTRVYRIFAGSNEIMKVLIGRELLK
jgi:acyl-CoA dehydrogenase